MSVNYDTLNSKYKNNTRLWLRDLQSHHAYIKELVLGEDGEWRKELEFILAKTGETLDFVRDKLETEDFLLQKKHEDAMR